MSFLVESNLYEAECVLLAVLVGGSALFLLSRAIQRSRPDLNVVPPVAVAFGLRVLAIGAVSVFGSSSTLRGGDEQAFLFRARELSDAGLFSGASLDALTSEFHLWVLSLQARVPDFPEAAFRVGHVAIAVAGLLLLVGAVYELAGGRAARLAAWILAFEPASVFFSSVLHKESPMMLAGGLVAFGGAKLWARRDLTGLAPMLTGCAIAVATRPYAGWFLVAAAAAVILHASLTRRGERQARALLLAMIVALGVGVSLPTVLKESSDRNLQATLQPAQEGSTGDDANLSLERIDFSTRENVILNLPRRMRDVLFRPYIWQTSTVSQRVGVLGSFVFLVVLFLLAQAIARAPRSVITRAGPLVYPALFLFVAYSLSAGNAGTSFRYRTHLALLGICLVVVLREQLQVTAAARASRAEPVPWLRDAAQPAR